MTSISVCKSLGKTKWNKLISWWKMMEFQLKSSSWYIFIQWSKEIEKSERKNVFIFLKMRSSTSKYKKSKEKTENTSVAVCLNLISFFYLKLIIYLWSILLLSFASDLSQNLIFLHRLSIYNPYFVHCFIKMNDIYFYFLYLCSKIWQKSQSQKSSWQFFLKDPLKNVKWNIRNGKIVRNN